MMRLVLVDKVTRRELDLGLYRFNDVAQCMNAARRKHPFLDRLEANQHEYKGYYEPGPLRHPQRDPQFHQQLALA